MQYTNGTISVNQGSVSVSGTGTLWLANINTDWVFVVEGDELFYEVSSIVNDTNLILTNPYAGTNKSNVSYVITRDYTKFFGWPTIARGDTEWPTVLTETLRRIDRDLHATPKEKPIKYLVFQPLTDSPADPEEGTLYYDATAQEFKVYDGADWKSIVAIVI